jgi:peptidyl-prolyl cis-trans isomerase B (cyclophilin B)
MSTPATAQEHAVIKTAYGEMTLAFWPDVAPKTVENFKKLAREGFYNGTAFHRIIKGFMIQGGCPKGTGTGDAGYKLKAEFNDTPHVAGVISIARAQDPDSAGCQFFICHGDARFLDRQYTAFGRIDPKDSESMATLDKIAGVAVVGSGMGETSKPKDKVAMDRITVTVQA